MSEGVVLAIDTAGTRCSAAVLDRDGSVRARRQPEIGRGHAERLTGLVGEVLSEAGLVFADIARIAVTVGPGSFTGLRVGVAAARGFALTLGVPAVGVSTLEALAEPHWAAGPVLAVLDAKRGEAYLALYAEGGAERLSPRAVPLEELSAILAGVEPPVCVVGSGGPLVAGLPNLGQAAFREVEGHVDVAAVGRLGARKPVGAAPSPLYLRGADAKPQTDLVSLRT